MATPSEKSEQVEAVISLFAPEGKDRREVIRKNECINGCVKPLMRWKDALSEKEYRISGMCQSCQDEFFIPPDDEE